MTEQATRQRVLVVDDEEGALFLLSEKMRALGYEVDTARNGQEALAKAASFLPDIVLLDVMMPLMDGYEACRRLKSDGRMRNVPVILLTAKSEMEDKIAGLDAGADDYITKPYSMPEVSARVRSLLRLRALQSKLIESEKLAALGEMVDGIAHEIRNPLVTIGGMARRLYEHETDQEHRRYAENILKAALRMERMMARIDEYKGILSPKTEMADLNVVVGAAVDEARAYAAGRKGVTIKAVMPEAPVRMNMSAVNIKTAVFNVIQNAIEAVEGAGGDVTVEVAAGGSKEAAVKITDNGPGMDKDTVRSMFHPFYTSKMTGAGLGLTITYRIVHDHGGSIDVASEKGKGTSVTVRLPAAKA